MTNRLRPLKPNTEYLMQIVDATFERKSFKRGRDTFTFDVRIWPEYSNLEWFIEISEIFYDGGYAEKYLENFIENSTGGIYGEIGISEMIGAVFWGKIIKSTEHKDDCVKVHYHLNAVSHIGYATIDVYEAEAETNSEPQ